MNKFEYIYRKENIANRNKSASIFRFIIDCFYCFFLPIITILTTEWNARGSLGPDEPSLAFFDALRYNPSSFVITYLLLFFAYISIFFLTNKHWPAIVFIGLFGNLIGSATFFKLAMRNEPLLPWDLLQIDEFIGIIEGVELLIQPSMIITLLIYALLLIASILVTRLNQNGIGVGNVSRLVVSLTSGIATLVTLFFVFFNPAATLALDIHPDMWMQDRYYRYYGSISGFLTNVSLLNIEKPDGYSKQTVQEIVAEIEQNNQPFIYENSNTNFSENIHPDIIFVMAEGFWDMEELPGISYDRELMPNFDRLAEEAAGGWAYSPSYGGGTCDVEFEALTGFSMEFLPSGSKPFQQYINDDIFSLPWLLKQNGYETMAIHGYGAQFWNRDIAYPRLGIDTFIAEEQMPDAERRRGFISDNAMIDRIIAEQSSRSSDENPLFIHAVTMQNHTTYSPTSYPSNEMVSITDNSAGLSENIIGELSDCATGISEMDSALGKLTDYLLTVERPTIVVFWGDHLNPMSDGYGFFEDTGFIQQGDTSDPNLYKLPLLIWSNVQNTQVDLGVLSTYNIPAVMMELYGMESSYMLFDLLQQQLNAYTASSKGVMFFEDESYTRERTDSQEELLYMHSILQYDLLFGEKYLLDINGLSQ